MDLSLTIDESILFNTEKFKVIFLRKTKKVIINNKQYWINKIVLSIKFPPNENRYVNLKSFLCCLFR